MRRVAALTIKWPAFTAPRLSAVHVGEDSARLQTSARVVFMNMTSLMAARVSCPVGDRQGNGAPFGHHYGARRTARSSAIVIRDRGSLSPECASERSRALGEGRRPLADPLAGKRGFRVCPYGILTVAHN